MNMFVQDKMAGGSVCVCVCVEIVPSLEEKDEEF